MPTNLILILVLGLTFICLAKVHEKYNNKLVLIAGIVIILLEILAILSFTDQLINLMTK